MFLLTRHETNTYISSKLVHNRRLKCVRFLVVSRARVTPIAKIKVRSISNQECTKLRSISFTRLDYPLAMINSIITRKTIQSFSFGTREKNKEDSSVVRVSLPSKDQTSANAVKSRQMGDLTITRLAPHYNPCLSAGRKLEQELKPREMKPLVVNECVVYSFICDPCDSYYVGFTALHGLYQRIVEYKNSAIGKHFSTAHGETSLLKDSRSRKILIQRQGKLDCLVYEVIFIKQRIPSLNTQIDSIRAKLFV